MLAQRVVAGAALIVGAASLLPAGAYGQEVDKPAYTCIVTTKTTTTTTYYSDGSIDSFTVIVITRMCTPS